MKKIRLIALFIGLALTATASHAAPQKNILLLCIDDLRPELKSFGADYIQSPNIDRLAATGRAFHHHYVNAPSCGPSRYTMLTGSYGPAGNQALFQRAQKLAKHPESVTPSMPEWFRKNGYTTVSVGKVSHHPGGRGGSDWNDDSKIEVPRAWDRHLMPCGEWQHPRGAMHGLSNGQTRVHGATPAFESAEGPDTIYPDGLIAREGIAQLTQLAAADKPFFLACGLIKPHLPFGAPAAYMAPYKDVKLPPVPHPEKPAAPTTRHKYGEFVGQYNHHGMDPRTDADYADQVRRHYAACVTYADHHVGQILAALEKSGKARDTIIVLWGDHGWHLGEHNIWGKHSLFEESLRSPLIISAHGMNQPGAKSDAVVESTDIFPTLCELTDLPEPEFSSGTSLTPQLANPATPGHTAIAYNGGARTIRTATHRLTLHNNGAVELYDHSTTPGETANIASQHPDIVAKLKQQLAKKLARTTP
ncbi:MAG: sulfatase [Verrucomicrobiales bacterium]